MGHQGEWFTTYTYNKVVVKWNGQSKEILYFIQYFNLTLHLIELQVYCLEDINKNWMILPTILCNLNDATHFSKLPVTLDHQEKNQKHFLFHQIFLKGSSPTILFIPPLSTMKHLHLPFTTSLAKSDVEQARTGNQFYG